MSGLDEKSDLYGLDLVAWRWRRRIQRNFPRLVARVQGNKTLSRFVVTARAVADADPDEIEAAATEFGRTRPYLAPVAWAAGTLVLVIRGIKLLFLNWRLTIVELIPAAWVWLVLVDLKRHRLRAEPLQHFTFQSLVTGLAIAVAASIAAFWFNTVFGFAITHRPKPKVGLAFRQARPFFGRCAVLGSAMGVIVALGLAIIPRIEDGWLYWACLFGLYSFMLTCLVLVPARLLGVRKQRLPPKQTLGSWVTGGALSAVAMTPGFVLDRIGIAMLSVPGFQVLGLLVLSAGTALYAAGLSSVRAIKLSMKLEPLMHEGAHHPPPTIRP